MRYVIIGAGAVGGVVAARLAATGQDVAVVARGAHLSAIRQSGLRVRSATADRHQRLPAFESPRAVDWRPDDVAIVAVKSMDTPTVLPDVPRGTPIVCLQNGVANEPCALRFSPRVYGVCVMLPSTHLDPGVVLEHCSPVPGILDLGPYPHAAPDDLARTLSAAFVEAGFHSEPRPDIMRWKHAKLLLNLGNAAEALCGRIDGLDELATLIRTEGESVLRAAAIPYASADEDRARRGDLLQQQPIDGVERAGGSTWQSLARGTGSVEADYLNGEIVLLGRRLGLATPYNATAQRLAVEAAARSTKPGSMSLEAFHAAVAGG